MSNVPQFLDRGWRLAGTAVLFAVFGIGGMAAGLTAFPAIALLSRDPKIRTRRARAFVRSTFRSFLWLMKTLRVARFDIEAGAAGVAGAERGTVVVANHPTLLDVVILLAHIDQANCVVKAALWRNPFLCWGVRAASYVPNDDLETLMGSCERALRDGQTLIVFPEATRTVPGRPIRLQRGAAAIALRANAHLRIVHLGCEPPTLSKNVPWYRIPARQPCFSMRIGGNVRARDYVRPGEHLGVATRRLTRFLQAELSRDVFAGACPSGPTTTPRRAPRTRPR